MIPKVYRVKTLEGSTFAFRFHHRVTEDGIDYGPLVVVGYSKRAGKVVEVRGVGCRPERGSRVVISDKPMEVYDVEGETVPVYDFEVISSVEEIRIPEKILLKLQQNAENTE